MTRTFEVYEDAAGEYRWRLRASNGEIVADSGEGYVTRDGAMNAVERVQTYAPEADTLEIGQAAFEIYQDAAGEWRWRLRHRNGNIIAAASGGYASRSNARNAVERMQDDIDDVTLERR